MRIWLADILRSKLTSLSTCCLRAQTPKPPLDWSCAAWPAFHQLLGALELPESSLQMQELLAEDLPRAAPRSQRSLSARRVQWVWCG